MNSLFAKINALRTSNPKPAPTFTYYPFTDVSLKYAFRNRDLIPVSANYTLEDIANYKPFKQNHQILLRTDEISPLMEWDIREMLARNCTIKVRISALRDYELLYCAHQFLIEIVQDDDLICVMEELALWPGVTMYLVQQENQIEFPANYSYDALQYGINFARVSFHNTRSTNDFRWFVIPRQDVPNLRLHFPVPGCMLGQHYESLQFYIYEPLTGIYHTQGTTPATVYGKNATALAHQRRQAQYLKLKADTFIDSHNYSTSESMLAISRNILCPQQSRLYLRHSYMSPTTGQTYKQNVARQPQVKDKKQDVQTRFKHGNRHHGVNKNRGYSKQYRNQPINEMRQYE